MKSMTTKMGKVKNDEAGLKYSPSVGLFENQRAKQAEIPKKGDNKEK
jgi:hypothetical protein